MNEFTITKNNKKFDDFNFVTGDLDGYDVLFLTKEYFNDGTHLIFKNYFHEFLEEKDDSSLNILEYKMRIDKVRLDNSQFWQIIEFIVCEIALPLVINYLYDFIKSKMKNDDMIQLNMIIERENKESLCMHYYGKSEEFMAILDKTNSLKDLIDNNDN